MVGGIREEPHGLVGVVAPLQTAGCGEEPIDDRVAEIAAQSTCIHHRAGVGVHRIKERLEIGTRRTGPNRA
jgi:hypothetical protein